MFCKRLGIAAVFCLLLAFPLSASMVSFVVVESGLNPNAAGNEYSTVWESGLMGAFFDAGHIVSNSPVLRLEKPSASGFSGNEIPGEVQRDFLSAQQGGADYFILVILDFTVQNGRTRPQVISIRIFSTSTRELIYDHIFPAGTGVNLQDEAVKARDTARIIAAQMPR